MNDIKLGISKSRGYENVDLEEMCNEKTPQDGEEKQAITETRVSFGDEKIVMSVSDREKSANVTLTSKSITFALNKKSPK